jgi:PAS domain S-box-containing protein
MSWLALGVVYSAGYAVAGWSLRDNPLFLSWFRAVALLIPPMAGTIVIFRRRHTWSGCQWLFWSTIALGLAMSAIGLTGWTVDEFIYSRETWLAWPAVFALFGSVAPLFALLAQPHRGVRETLAATTAVDIAGLAVVTGFLYSFFVTAPDPLAGGEGPSLQLVAVLQQFVVVAGLLAATWAARETPWRATYRRLSLGAFVSLLTLTLSSAVTNTAEYQSGYVYDFTWILPFAFFPWAASLAPASEADAPVDEEELARPRPWVIFTAVALVPFLDFGLRRVAPEASEGMRDLSTAVAIISVLPLLVARIAAERAEMQRAGGTMRLLADVIEQAQEFILVLTPDGRCRHANEAFCRAMNMSREDVMRMSPRDLLTHETVSPGDIEALVRGGGRWRGTITRMRADGTSFPVAASIAALVDDHGRVTHLVSVERDISEERRLREQLIHSERLSAVGQLVAGVAHEINNPLQSIAGFTELMINAGVGRSNAEARRDLEQIRSDAHRAAKIVRHLLAFVRRSTLERSVAELNEIVRTTVALRAYELRSTGIELRQEYASDLPLLVVNREEIQQVVLNLLLNAEYAVRSLGLGGVIGVRTGALDSVAFVEVTDDGPGIPSASAGRVFEPFFTTKPVGEGTGLGLSVSLGIAQAHGGALELMPSERGARFRLALPAAQGVPVDLDAVPAAATSPSAHPFSNVQ